MLGSFVEGAPLDSLPHVGLPWKATSCLCSCHFGERGCDNKVCERAALHRRGAVSALVVSTDRPVAASTTRSSGARKPRAARTPVSAPATVESSVSPVTDETLSAQEREALLVSTLDLMALGVPVDEASTTARSLLSLPVPSTDEDETVSALRALGLSEDDIAATRSVLGA